MHVFILITAVAIAVVFATPTSDLFKREGFCAGLLHQKSCTPGHAVCCGTGRFEGDIYMKCQQAPGVTHYGEEYCPGGTVCKEVSNGTIQCTKSPTTPGNHG